MSNPSEDACVRQDARVSTTILSPARPGASHLLLRRRAGATAAPDCEIALRADDGDEIAFGPFWDCEAIALWRDLADRTGAVPGIQGPDGALHWPYRQIGRIRMGEVDIARRRRHAGARRPRFLVRRKTGRLPRRPLVFRECEMAGGRD